MDSKALKTCRLMTRFRFRSMYSSTVLESRNLGGNLQIIIIMVSHLNMSIARTSIILRRCLVHMSAVPEVQEMLDSVEE